MRLWHIDLIPKLPRQQLLGQWREIHAIIGTINKHGKVNHSTINYVNDHPMSHLLAYAYIVKKEMENRGYKPDFNKLENKFEKYIGCYYGAVCHIDWYLYEKDPIYPEHNDEYMQECLENLRGKGVEI